MKRLLILIGLMAVALASCTFTAVKGAEGQSKAQAKRFQVVHDQGWPAVRVIQDTATGACFVYVNPGGAGSGLAEAPKEVCEVTP